MPKAETDIVIAAPIHRVFSVITDYESYPEFLPEIRSVRVESRHDGVVLAHFELELIMRISYTLRLEETAPTTVRWSLKRAKMMKENLGGWTLRDAGEGKTHATYGLEIKLRGLIPRSVSTRLVGQTLPQTMQRFKTRAESGASR